MDRLSQDERNWATFVHLAAVAGFLIPFGHLFGPLALWLYKRQEMAFVDEHGKEAVNFQISVTLYTCIIVLLMFVAIGFVLLAVEMVAVVVLMIIAAVKANNGEHYRYPMTIRLIK